MSRQSKNAKRKAAAAQITAMHKNGEKGPAKTQAQHGKKNAWWQKFPSFSAAMAGGKRKGRDSDTAAQV